MEIILALTAAVLGSSAITALINAWLNRHRVKADTRQVLIDTDRVWIETVDKVRDFVLEEVVRLQAELKLAREEASRLRIELKRAEKRIAELTEKLDEAEARLALHGHM